jgi:integrase
MKNSTKHPATKTERIKGWLDDPELLTLLRKADPPLALAIVLMCDAGCRLREALSFDVSSLSGEMLRIWASKTHSWRTVPLTPRLSAAIDAATTPTLLPSLPPAPLAGLNPRTIQRRLHSLGDLAGTQPTTPHRLRHSYASRLAAEGVPIHIISALLGHKNLSVTLLYIHGGQDAYTKAATALDRRRKQALGRPTRGTIQAGSGPKAGRRS